MVAATPLRTADMYATAAQWTAANFVLYAGERGIESDTGRSKTGDGTTPWNSLNYNAAIVAAWVANTLYYAGTIVVYNGLLLRRKSTGTSGSTIDMANWDTLGFSADSVPWLPADNAWVAANYSPEGIQAGTFMVAGRDYVFKLKVRAGVPVNNLVLPINTFGSSDAAGYYSALFDSTGALVPAAVTADFGTSVRTGAPAGPAVVAYGTPWTPSSSGYAYVNVHTGTATTQPKLSTTAAAVIMNAGLVGTAPGATAPRFSVPSNGWTGATPPATLGSLSVANALTAHVALS